MSAATTSSGSHLPPTPPPSPPQVRRRHKKNDPFLDADLAATHIAENNAGQGEEGQEQQDSLLTKILLTPILMTSFILSLLYITRIDALRRTSPQRTSFLHPTTWFSPPEPYQSPNSTAWGHANANAKEFDRQLQYEVRGGGRWHLHKKIRKIAKLEIRDAFEMRRRVIVLMVTVALIICASAVYALQWLWGWACVRWRARGGK